MMKKSLPLILAFGILFLFFIQSAGTLVESIYILNLLGSGLNEKALALLFFFLPLLLLPFFRKYSYPLGWVLFGVLLLTRGLAPYLLITNRLITAGIATGAALGLLLLFLGARPRGEADALIGPWGGAALALAVSLSVLLRTVGDGIEYSLTPGGGWVGWVLAVLLGLSLTQVDWRIEPARLPKRGPVTAPLVGVYMVVILTYFAFSAPAVIARWTEGNYILIVTIISLLSVGTIWLSLFRPGWIERISQRVRLAWNLLFTLSLTGTLLAHRVVFSPTLQSPPVVVGAPTIWQQIPLVFTLLLFPVLYIDLRVYLQQLQRSAPSPHDLAPGIILGSFALILLIFVHIFTNVWGYVDPVSTPFRNMFWLPYFLPAGLLSLLIWRSQPASPVSEPGAPVRWRWLSAGILAVIFLVTVIFALPAPLTPPSDEGKSSLVAMTYNVQQFNDETGEKSFDRQLALIRRVSPDILAMQETDSARISLNNNDYVRYFAEKLRYYIYYGPKTVTGT